MKLAGALFLALAALAGAKPITENKSLTGTSEVVMLSVLIHFWFILDAFRACLKRLKVFRSLLCIST